ncbi:hypothetical protein N7468_001495 [Penicillium chermesinum]|uniref:Glycogen debranching enzyme n=1 Tax=Penicillium chermesinum TaxID=63820 RepID=A0A9W9PI08_9EURO|nr:uncharacterized protein N7468_001495 [Penicillium chermesinum]KAJ5246512.1 hypothetical protein N7468_001495 [Penicillium chermesinum]
MRVSLQLGSLAVALSAANAKHLQPRSNPPACNNSASTLSLTEAPYNNYFYSDCNVAAQAVITSPQQGSDLTRISPRLIVAWPAGNSGICTFFAPQNGENGTLALELVNSTVGSPLGPVYNDSLNTEHPSVGIQGVLRLNSSATLSTAILGSIRTIRDFVEGPSILYPEIQDAVQYTSSEGRVSLSRLWLDNVTTTSLTFQPWDNSSSSKASLSNRTVSFEAGEYLFAAQMNYPQLSPLKPEAVLIGSAVNLTTTMPDQTTALSFLSYSEKLLAGAWRFLTYFGRDSMISALLLEPVLRTGNGTAMEAVLGAVLERVNRTDGSVCHEETIGDYATWSNAQNNVTSTAMLCDYKMIDSDYFLPVLMQKYLLEDPVGQKRARAFFNTPAGSINAANKNLTWGELAIINAKRIMRLAAPFANEQKKGNLIHLKEGQVVGQWRDSTYGMASDNLLLKASINITFRHWGGGRIPFDVNTALVPAALRSIAALYADHNHWARLADQYAQTWEDKSLEFFEVNVMQSDARELVESYKNRSAFEGPSQSASIDTDVTFYSLALEGNNHLEKVAVMNTDDCYRHFLLNTTNDDQLSRLLNSTATNIQRTFPAGLMTDAGMIVANPAFGADPVYAQNWTTGAYHGTVVWSWQLAMMAKGLERQLGRCEVRIMSSRRSSAKPAPAPGFCTDSSIYDNVVRAYNALWDSIEHNSAQLSSEVWSWVYRDGKFQVTQLASLPPPPGAGGQTESDIRQLWSLAFLAVTRNENYR